MLSSNIFLIIYALAWMWLFFYHKKRVHNFGAGSFLLLLYVIFSCASIVLFNHQEFVMGQSKGWEELYILPLVYLFFALWFTSTPILNYDKSNVSVIVPPNSQILNIVAIVIVASSVWSVMIHWNYIVQGLTMMLMNVDNAADLYADKTDVYDNLSAELKGANLFQLLLHYLYTLFRDFNILFFFYYLTQGKSKTIASLLGIGTFFEILFSISSGNRTGILLPVFTIAITFFAFSGFFKKEVRKQVVLVSSIVGAVIIFFFALITFSRFGDHSAGTQGSMIFYAGQANLNFDVYAFDNGGIRYGDRTMMLFKGWFDDATPSNRGDLLAKYPSLKITDGLFSTYIGDIMMDYGPILTSLIILLFTLIINKVTRPKRGRMYFDQIILLYFVMCICSRGCMYLFDFSLKGGNWRMVGFLLMYMLFRLTREENPFKSNYKYT